MDRTNEMTHSMQTKSREQEEALLDQIAKETEKRKPFAVAQECPVSRDKLKAAMAIEEEFMLAGAGTFYSWHLGGKSGGQVEGIGIDGSMIIMRNWGNCTYEVDLTAESKDYWLFAATFIDLETGASFQRLFRQRKSGQVAGNYDAERKLDMAFQIGQSKAIRNAILAAMPDWLKDRALSAAKEGAVAQVTDLKKSINKVVEGFTKRLGATLGEMEVFVGKPEARWNKEDVVTLTAVGKAVKEQQIDIHDALAPVVDDKPELEPAPSAPASEESMTALEEWAMNPDLTDDQQARVKEVLARGQAAEVELLREQLKAVHGDVREPGEEG